MRADIGVGSLATARNALSEEGVDEGHIVDDGMNTGIHLAQVAVNGQGRLPPSMSWEGHAAGVLEPGSRDGCPHRKSYIW